MTRSLLPLLAVEIKKLLQAGLYKRDEVFLPDGREAFLARNLINFTSHDYLGLARHPEVIDAAITSINTHGFGQASARMMGGTRGIHQQLEEHVASFLRYPKAMLFGSGYHVNLGLFQAFFDDRDYVFCDALIHPSLAEGVRLSGAKTFTFRNNDIQDLEDKLKRSRAARFRAIVTTGVFPFDGQLADLIGICGLAKKFDSLVIVDDTLGIGVLGNRGRGSCENSHTIDQVDLVTGSFGCALGGSTGGFAAGREEIILWLRQKCTTYLFSGNISPAMAGGALKALTLLDQGKVPIDVLNQRTKFLRGELTKKGFNVLPSIHPIIAVMVGEVITLQKMINLLYEDGIFAHGLCYPVVPEREARIIFQVTANHTEKDLQTTIKAMESAGRIMGVK